MIRSMIVTGAILASTLVAPAAMAYTIGFVDTAKVLTTYSGATAAQKKMASELQAYQKAFAERQQKIAAAHKAGKSQAEIQKLTEQYERELAPMKEKAQRLEQQLSANVKTKVESVIHTIAQRRKVDVVIDKAAVLHGGVDLTNDVIKALK